tara:strand:- start:146 stop:1000 length:855 start_codon:yes stop_codon:yes gene_type:complete
MRKILILGYGYVGGYLYTELKKKHDVVIIKKDFLDYTNSKDLIKFLKSSAFDYVINAFGFTGRPNVDEGELKPELCYELNTLAPLKLSAICQCFNINYIHISSGCIYTNYEKEYNEYDEPNFGFFNEESSTYSKSKHAFELGCDHGLILRVRMPFCDKLHDRSYLTKIKKYNNLIDLKNSKTYIPQLLDFVGKIIQENIETKEKDIVNFVQPNPLLTSDVTKIMEECKVFNSDWSWVQFEELNCIANRSNCVLSTEKLKNKYEFDVMDEELAIRTALNNILMDE